MIKKKKYTPICLGDTKGLSNEVWLKWRMHGPKYESPKDPLYVPVAIGGSDAGVIEGASDFKSKLELFHEKSGIMQPKYKRKMNQEILDNGHDLEEYVANHFKQFMCKNCGMDPASIEIINDTNLYQHPLFPFALCNLDRRLIINGYEGILELKTTGNYSDIQIYWKKGIVPEKYEWQCRYYMATMNVDFAYIACMWGFTLNEMAVIKLSRDHDVERKMLSDIKEFVEYCEMGIEPPMQLTHTGELSKYYVRLYGEIDERATPVEFDDTDETRKLFAEINNINNEKGLLEKSQENLAERESVVVAKLLKLTEGRSVYGFLRLDDEHIADVKINIPMHKPTFDEEGFKASFSNVYNEFLKPTDPKLDTAKLKKKYPTEYNQFVVPAMVNLEKKPSIGKFEIKKSPTKTA